MNPPNEHFTPYNNAAAITHTNDLIPDLTIDAQTRNPTISISDYHLDARTTVSPNNLRSLAYWILDHIKDE